MVKKLPAMQETGAPSLGREIPLEKGMSAHSSLLAWRIPQTEEPGSHRPCGHKESNMTEQLSLTHTDTHTKAHTQTHTETQIHRRHTDTDTHTHTHTHTQLPSLGMEPGRAGSFPSP